MIGVRIKEERKKTKLNQTDFAKLAGASKRTLIDWEKSNSSPTAVQLNMLAKYGVDVLYILTGERLDSDLAILDKFNRAITQASSEVEKARLIIAREDEIGKQAIRRENKIMREAEVENYRNLLYEMDDETFESVRTMLNELLGQSLLKERLEDFKEKTSDNSRRPEDEKSIIKGHNVGLNQGVVSGDGATFGDLTFGK